MFEIFIEKIQYLLNIYFLQEISALKYQCCRNIDFMLEIYAMKGQSWLYSFYIGELIIVNLAKAQSFSQNVAKNKIQPQLTRC